MAAYMSRDGRIDFAGFRWKRNETFYSSPQEFVSNLSKSYDNVLPLGLVTVTWTVYVVDDLSFNIFRTSTSLQNKTKINSYIYA